MAPRSRRARAVASAALTTAILLVGAACSSSSGTQTTSSSSSSAPSTSAAGGSTTSSADGTSTTTRSGSTSGTAAPSSSDAKAAEAALVTASDVPDGFSKTRSSSADTPNPFIGVPACKDYEQAIKASDDQRTAKAKISFANAAKDEIQQTVEVYSDAKVAKDAAAALADAGFPACIEAAFTAALKSTMPAGASVDSLKAERADVPKPADLGVDTSNGFTLDVTLTADGQTATVKMFVVMMTSGRMMSQVTTQGTKPFDVSGTMQAAAKALVANAPA